MVPWLEVVVNKSADDAGFDPTAWIALVLSVVGIVSQVFLRYLDGGRVRVRLRSAMMSQSGDGIMRLVNGKWKIDPEAFSRLEPSFSVDNVMEVAEVVVENVGRHAVTVSDIGLEWRERRAGKLTRERHHIVPRAFKVEGHGRGNYVDKQPVRIEPADQVSFLFDYWLILPPDRYSGRRRRRRLRASAKVAGRRRATRSSRRLAWTISDSDVSAIDGREALSVGSIIARVMAREGYNALGAGRLYAHFLELELSSSGWPDDYAAKAALLDRAIAAMQAKHPYLAKDESVWMTFELIRELDTYSSRIRWPFPR